MSNEHCNKQLMNNGTQCACAEPCSSFEPRIIMFKCVQLAVNEMAETQQRASDMKNIE